MVAIYKNMRTWAFLVLSLPTLAEDKLPVPATVTVIHQNEGITTDDSANWEDGDARTRFQTVVNLEIHKVEYQWKGTTFTVWKTNILSSVSTPESTGKSPGKVRVVKPGPPPPMPPRSLPLALSVKPAPTTNVLSSVKSIKEDIEKLDFEQQKLIQQKRQLERELLLKSQ